MHSTSIAITVLAALANGYAACLGLLGAASVTATADRVHVSRRWMAPLGGLLALGALGLVLGLEVPALGTAAAAGLVLYFTGALTAHVRARDPEVAGAVVFLLLAVAALVADLGPR